MILLDNKADTFPCGLIGTPFEAVYKALRTVAADVWAVDPTVYRAGMAWGWYALHRPEKLVGFLDVVAAALVSAFAPLVKDTQTDAELVEYLRQWRDYTPTFGRLQALYALFGATVDIQPITDPESQAVLPVADTRLAFYVRITEVDFSRPLSLDDAREIALRATPLGSRPYVYYAIESRTQIHVAAIPQAPEVFVENWEIATPAAPPVPLGDFILVDLSGNVVYSVENLTEIEFTPTGYFTIDEGNEVVFVEQSPFPVVCIDEGTRTPESIAPDASFDTELPYYDSKLYIVTTDDGQDETLYGWEAEEGTAGPVLPEVSVTGDFLSYNWLDNGTPGQGTPSSVSPNSYVTLYIPNTSTIPTYDSTKSYGIIQWQTTAGTTAGRTEFSIVESSGNIAAKNVSGSTQSFYATRVAVCSSSDATVVTVYDSSNVAYNAFKYTADGVDYYYVLDGTQTDWTSDLSSIGYHIPLPTVTLDAGWCSISPNHTRFPSGDTKRAVNWYGYDWRSWSYDSSKAYAAWWWRSESRSAYYGTVLSDNGDGYFGITNALESAIERYVESRYSTCESPDAVAIQVLNSSNVAYAAFKYTRGGIDYYYVLDEVQTDWTDDLSSIGYHV